MTDDLHARIRAALDGCRVCTPDAQADAVMAVLDEASPPQLTLAPEQVSDEEMARLHRLWLEAQADSTGGLVILPPNASDLWRRYTPEQRRDWLTEHRDDAIERGIPGDLVDLIIQDGEDGQ